MDSGDLLETEPWTEQDKQPKNESESDTQKQDDEFRSECFHASCSLCPFLREWKQRFPHVKHPEDQIYRAVTLRLQETAIQHCYRLAQSCQSELDASDKPFIFMHFVNLFEAVHTPSLTLTTLSLIESYLSSTSHAQEEELIAELHRNIHSQVTKDTLESGHFVLVVLIEEPKEGARLTVTVLHRYTLEQRKLVLAQKYGKECTRAFGASLKDMLGSLWDLPSCKD